MNTPKFLKKLSNWFIMVLIFFLIGYFGYRVYDAVVESVTKRIRQEVSKEIIDTFNPFKWPGKIFGRKSKKNNDE